ncbi:MAG: DUF424 family protein [Aeropyrum sp.]|nr:DUF424 family protein [Aeropyrum sp.]MCE4615967.1 DUF424 family protein [Aeropyrum sp.]
MYYVRKIKTPEGFIMVTVTDEEVLDRAAYDEERGIRLVVSRSFYKGDLLREAQVLEAIQEADIIVLTGERSVQLGISLGLVHPDSVLEVKGLKQVQVFKFLY